MMSYLLVLMLPLAFSAVLFNGQYVSRYRQEVISQLTATADKALLNLDMHVRQLTALTLQVSVSKPFSNQNVAKNSIAYMDIIRELQNYVNANLLLTEMIYYNGANTDTIYTSRGTFHPKYYARYRLGGESVQAMTFFRALTGHTWVAVDGERWRGGRYEHCVELIMPVPGMEDAYVGYFIAEGTLLNLVTLSEAYADMTLLLDRQGKPLLTTSAGSEKPLALAEAAFAKGERVVLEAIGDGRYLLCVISDSTGLGCAYVLSEAALFGKVDAMRNVFLWVMLAVMLLGGAAVYAISLWQAGPISRLASLAGTMVQDDGDVLPGVEGELPIIKNALEQVHNQNVSLREAQQRSQQSAVLMRLISGQYQQRRSVDRDCKQARIAIEGRRFMVLLIEEISIATAELAQGIEGYFAGEVAAYGFRYQEQQYQVFLLALRQGTALTQETVFQRLVQVYPSLFLTLGSTYEDPLQIYMSYQDAIFAKRKQQLKGTQASVMGTEQSRKQGELLYPKQEIDALYRILLSRDKEKLAFIQDVLMHSLQDISYSAFFQKAFCYDIINTYNRALASLGIGGHSEPQRLKQYMHKDLVYLDALIAHIDALYKEAVEAFAEESAQETLDEMEQLAAFVDAHVEDPQLNVRFVADAFGMTVSNLSHRFKKHTGDNLSDYIVMRKVESARWLLSHTSQSVTEITARLGYNHPSSFIRMFQRSVGMTPAKYRELYGEDQSGKD